MKISTKGRYGLRAMADLAAHCQDGFVSLNNIAERQDLSVNYLEHMFSALKKAGLVLGLSGSQGGYKLANRPVDITIRMILQVLEGDLSVSSPTAKEDTDLRKYIQNQVWDRIDRRIHQVIDQTTLADLLQRHISVE